MKAVIIGASGHVEYALQSTNSRNISACAPGSSDEDMSRLLLAQSHLRVYSNYVEMLECEQPDIAIINPHFHLIGTVILACLNRGIHCFAEKPLALDFDTLTKQQNHIQQGNARLGTMMIHRYEPWFYAAFETSKSGAIGKIISINARKSYKMGQKTTWMQQKKYFGGIMPWVGAHAIDWLQWFCPGPWKIINATQTKMGNKNMGQVESAAQISLRGATCMAQVHLDYLRPAAATSHGDDRLLLTGERGTIEVINQKSYLTTDQQNTITLPMHEMPNIFDHFVASIAGVNPYYIPENDSIKVAQLCIEAENMAYEIQ
ncbi:hypothetical protein GC194_03530 [bacterium]|nr:hypothetical protein [bacterium]